MRLEKIKFALYSMTKQEKIAAFDPNGLGSEDNNLYGLPFTEEESDTVIFPVPWEVTVSYGSGTAGSADAIMAASLQVDLYDADVPDAWKAGIFMKHVPNDWLQKSNALREQAEIYIGFLEEGGNVNENEELKKVLDTINKECQSLHEWVKAETAKLIAQNKFVGVLGGDHSSPLGLMQALANKYDYGILHIDAHCDLRDSFEGFTYSHASIFFNALKIPQVTKLVQVGIRDFCEAELNVAKNSNNRIKIFFDADIRRRQYEGEAWKTIVDNIVKELPKNVYISFDIDGLDPKLCPHTGTPVAGGLEMEQSFYLIKKVVDSGRKIIGFDLCEVSPGEDEWDANVGARVLYKLCNLGNKSFRHGT